MCHCLHSCHLCQSGVIGDTVDPVSMKSQHVFISCLGCYTGDIIDICYHADTGDITDICYHADTGDIIDICYHADTCDIIDICYHADTGDIIDICYHADTGDIIDICYHADTGDIIYICYHAAVCGDCGEDPRKFKHLLECPLLPESLTVCNSCVRACVLQWRRKV